MIDLNNLNDLKVEAEKQQHLCGWEELSPIGRDKPGPLAHHSSVVFEGRMYLYGGSNLERENPHLFSLDLKTYEWRIVKPAVSGLTLGFFVSSVQR
jgi:hypothetical protein